MSNNDNESPIQRDYRSLLLWFANSFKKRPDGRMYRQCVALHSHIAKMSNEDYPSISNCIARCITSYIQLTRKHRRKTPEFLEEIRNMIFFLHHNQSAIKHKGKFPFSDLLVDLLIQYIILELEMNVRSISFNDKAVEQEVANRIFRVLSIILFDLCKNSTMTMKAAVDASSIAALKILTKLQTDYGNENKLYKYIINYIMEKLLRNLGIMPKLEEIIRDKSCMSFSPLLNNPALENIRKLLDGNYGSVEEMSILDDEFEDNWKSWENPFAFKPQRYDRAKLGRNGHKEQPKRGNISSYCSSSKSCHQQEEEEKIISQKSTSAVPSSYDGNKGILTVDITNDDEDFQDIIYVDPLPQPHQALSDLSKTNNKNRSILKSEKCTGVNNYSGNNSSTTVEGPLSSKEIFNGSSVSRWTEKSFFSDENRNRTTANESNHEIVEFSNFDRRTTNQISESKSTSTVVEKNNLTKCNSDALTCIIILSDDDDEEVVEKSCDVVEIESSTNKNEESVLIRKNSSEDPKGPDKVKTKRQEEIVLQQQPTDIKFDDILNEFSQFLNEINPADVRSKSSCGKRETKELSNLETETTQTPETNKQIMCDDNLLSHKSSTQIVPIHLDVALVQQKHQSPQDDVNLSSTKTLEKIVAAKVNLEQQQQNVTIETTKIDENLQITRTKEQNEIVMLEEHSSLQKEVGSTFHKDETKTLFSKKENEKPDVTIPVENSSKFIGNKEGTENEKCDNTIFINEELSKRNKDDTLEIFVNVSGIDLSADLEDVAHEEIVEDSFVNETENGNDNLSLTGIVPNEKNEDLVQNAVNENANNFFKESATTTENVKEDGIAKIMEPEMSEHKEEHEECQSESIDTVLYPAVHEDLEKSLVTVQVENSNSDSNEKLTEPEIIEDMEHELVDTLHPKVTNKEICNDTEKNSVTNKLESPKKDLNKQVTELEIIGHMGVIEHEELQETFKIGEVSHFETTNENLCIDTEEITTTNKLESSKKDLNEKVTKSEKNEHTEDVVHEKPQETFKTGNVLHLETTNEEIFNDTEELSINKDFSEKITEPEIFEDVEYESVNNKKITEPEIFEDGEYESVNNKKIIDPEIFYNKQCVGHEEVQESIKTGMEANIDEEICNAERKENSNSDSVEKLRESETVGDKDIEHESTNTINVFYPETVDEVIRENIKKLTVDSSEIIEHEIIKHKERERRDELENVLHLEAAKEDLGESLINSSHKDSTDEIIEIEITEHKEHQELVHTMNALNFEAATKEVCKDLDESSVTNKNDSLDEDPTEELIESEMIIEHEESLKHDGSQKSVNIPHSEAFSEEIFTDQEKSSPTKENFIEKSEIIVCKELLKHPRNDDVELEQPITNVEELETTVDTDRQSSDVNLTAIKNTNDETNKCLDEKNMKLIEDKTENLDLIEKKNLEIEEQTINVQINTITDDNLNEETNKNEELVQIQCLTYEGDEDNCKRAFLVNEEVVKTEDVLFFLNEFPENGKLISDVTEKEMIEFEDVSVSEVVVYRDNGEGVARNENMSAKEAIVEFSVETKETSSNLPEKKASDKKMNVSVATGQYQNYHGQFDNSSLHMLADIMVNMECAKKEIPNSTFSLFKPKTKVKGVSRRGQYSKLQKNDSKLGKRTRSEESEENRRVTRSSSKGRVEPLEDDVIKIVAPLKLKNKVLNSLSPTRTAKSKKVDFEKTIKTEEKIVDDIKPVEISKEFVLMKQQSSIQESSVEIDNFTNEVLIVTDNNIDSNKLFEAEKIDVAREEIVIIEKKIDQRDEDDISVMCSINPNDNRELSSNEQTATSETFKVGEEINEECKTTSIFFCEECPKEDAMETKQLSQELVKLDKVVVYAEDSGCVIEKENVSKKDLDDINLKSQITSSSPSEDEETKGKNFSVLLSPKTKLLVANAQYQYDDVSKFSSSSSSSKMKCFDTSINRMENLPESDCKIYDVRKSGFRSLNINRNSHNNFHNGNKQECYNSSLQMLADVTLSLEYDNGQTKSNSMFPLVKAIPKSLRKVVKKGPKKSKFRRKVTKKMSPEEKRENKRITRSSIKNKTLEKGEYLEDFPAEISSKVVTPSTVQQIHNEDGNNKKKKLKNRTAIADKSSIKTRRKREKLKADEDSGVFTSEENVNVSEDKKIMSAILSDETLAVQQWSSEPDSPEEYQEVKRERRCSIYDEKTLEANVVLVSTADDVPAVCDLVFISIPETEKYPFEEESLLKQVEEFKDDSHEENSLLKQTEEFKDNFHEEDPLLKHVGGFKDGSNEEHSLLKQTEELKDNSQKCSSVVVNVPTASFEESDGISKKSPQIVLSDVKIHSKLEESSKISVAIKNVDENAVTKNNFEHKSESKSFFEFDNSQNSVVDKENKSSAFLIENILKDDLKRGEENSKQSGITKNNHVEEAIDLSSKKDLTMVATCSSFSPVELEDKPKREISFPPKLRSKLLSKNEDGFIKNRLNMSSTVRKTNEMLEPHLPLRTKAAVKLYDKFSLNPYIRLQKIDIIERLEVPKEIQSVERKEKEPSSNMINCNYGSKNTNSKIKVSKEIYDIKNSIKEKFEVIINKKKQGEKKHENRPRFRSKSVSIENKIDEKISNDKNESSFGMTLRGRSKSNDLWENREFQIKKKENSAILNEKIKEREFQSKKKEKNVILNEKIKEDKTEKQKDFAKVKEVHFEIKYDHQNKEVSVKKRKSEKAVKENSQNTTRKPKTELDIKLSTKNYDENKVKTNVAKRIKNKNKKKESKQEKLVVEQQQQNVIVNEEKKHMDDICTEQSENEITKDKISANEISKESKNKISKNEISSKDKISENEISSQNKISGNEISSKDKISENEISSKDKISENEISSEIKISENEISFKDKIPENELSSKNKISKNEISSKDKISENEISCIDKISENEISSKDKISENEISSEIKISEIEISSKDKILENEISSKDKISENEISSKDKISENEISSENKISENEISCKDKISENEISSKDKISENEISSKDKISENEISSKDKISENEISSENKISEIEISSKDKILENEISFKDKISENEVSSKNKISENEISSKDKISENEILFKDKIPENEMSSEDKTSEIESMQIDGNTKIQPDPTFETNPKYQPEIASAFLQKKSVEIPCDQALQKLECKREESSLLKDVKTEFDEKPIDLSDKNLDDSKIQNHMKNASQSENLIRNLKRTRTNSDCQNENICLTPSAIDCDTKQVTLATVAKTENKNKKVKIDKSKKLVVVIEKLKSKNEALLQTNSIRKSDVLPVEIDTQVVKNDVDNISEENKIKLSKFTNNIISLFNTFSKNESNKFDKKIYTPSTIMLKLTKPMRSTFNAFSLDFPYSVIIRNARKTGVNCKSVETVATNIKNLHKIISDTAPNSSKEPNFIILCNNLLECIKRSSEISHCDVTTSEENNYSSNEGNCTPGGKRSTPESSDNSNCNNDDKCSESSSGISKEDNFQTCNDNNASCNESDNSSNSSAFEEAKSRPNDDVTNPSTSNGTAEDNPTFIQPSECSSKPINESKSKGNLMDYFETETLNKDDFGELDKTNNLDIPVDIMNSYNTVKASCSNTDNVPQVLAATTCASDVNYMTPEIPMSLINEITTAFTSRSTDVVTQAFACRKDPSCMCTSVDNLEPQPSTMPSTLFVDETSVLEKVKTFGTFQTGSETLDHNYSAGDPLLCSKSESNNVSTCNPLENESRASERNPDIRRENMLRFSQEDCGVDSEIGGNLNQSSNSELDFMYIEDNPQPDESSIITNNLNQSNNGELNFMYIEDNPQPTENLKQKEVDEPTTDPYVFMSVFDNIMSLANLSKLIDNNPSSEDLTFSIENLNNLINNVQASTAGQKMFDKEFPNTASSSDSHGWSNNNNNSNNNNTNQINEFSNNNFVSLDLADIDNYNFLPSDECIAETETVEETNKNNLTPTENITQGSNFKITIPPTNSTISTVDFTNTGWPNNAKHLNNVNTRQKVIVEHLEQYPNVNWQNTPSFDASEIKPVTSRTELKKNDSIQAKHKKEINTLKLFPLGTQSLNGIRRQRNTPVRAPKSTKKIANVPSVEKKSEILNNNSTISNGIKIQETEGNNNLTPPVKQDHLEFRSDPPLLSKEPSLSKHFPEVKSTIVNNMPSSSANEKSNNFHGLALQKSAPAQKAEAKISTVVNQTSAKTNMDNNSGRSMSDSPPKLFPEEVIPSKLNETSDIIGNKFDVVKLRKRSQKSNANGTVQMSDSDEDDYYKLMKSKSRSKGSKSNSRTNKIKIEDGQGKGRGKRKSPHQEQQYLNDSKRTKKSLDDRPSNCEKDQSSRKYSSVVHGLNQSDSLKLVLKRVATSDDEEKEKEAERKRIRHEKHLNAIFDRLHQEGDVKKLRQDDDLKTYNKKYDKTGGVSTRSPGPPVEEIPRNGYHQKSPSKTETIQNRLNYSNSKKHNYPVQSREYAEERDSRRSSSIDDPKSSRLNETMSSYSRSSGSFGNKTSKHTGTGQDREKEGFQEWDKNNSCRRDTNAHRNYSSIDLTRNGYRSHTNPGNSRDHPNQREHDKNRSFRKSTSFNGAHPNYHYPEQQGYGSYNGRSSCSGSANGSSGNNSQSTSSRQYEREPRIQTSTNSGHQSRSEHHYLNGQKFSTNMSNFRYGNPRKPRVNGDYPSTLGFPKFTSGSRKVPFESSPENPKKVKKS